MKHIAILFLLTISALLYTNSLSAQDSIRTSIPDSVRYAAFDTNIIKNTARLSNSSEIFSYDEYIWSDKRSLSEILEMRGGYNILTLGYGERNPIRFLDMYQGQIGFFRDGANVNDIFYGGIDVENISVNEIDKIEEISLISSYLYGVNTGVRTVNIITKDFVQPQAFSQLRYSQDRYNSLFADVYFSQSFSRKFNLQFGLTKSSSDGRYTNSEFDKWQTRTKLNFYFSPKFNIKASFYFNKIERGLFSGLLDTTFTGIIPNNNTVVNSSDKENWTNLYSSLGLYLKLFQNPDNVTKIIFNYQNSLRKIDSLNLSDHDISFNIRADQNIGYVINNFRGDISLTAEFGQTKYNIYNASKEYFQSYLKNSLIFGNLTFLAYLKYINNNNKFSAPFEENYTQSNIAPGGELIFKIPFSSGNYMELYGGMNYYQDMFYLSETNPVYYNNNMAGVRIKYNDLDFDASGFNNIELNNYTGSTDYAYRGLTVKLGYKYKVMNLKASNDTYFFGKGTENFLRANLFYDDFLFNDNLHLKTGFIVKYYKNIFVAEYSMINNSSSHYIDDNYMKKDVFNVDFYVGARIGSANVNFTLANLFNRLNYDTFLYPYDDRGGLGNVISRFTIVWDFLN